MYNTLRSKAKQYGSIEEVLRVIRESVRKELDDRKVHMDAIQTHRKLDKGDTRRKTE